MVEKGEIAYHRLGGAIRVSDAQIAAYLEETEEERREYPVVRKISRLPQLKHVKLS